MLLSSSFPGVWTLLSGKGSGLDQVKREQLSLSSFYLGEL